MAERTIPGLWRDAVAKRRTTPAYLVETDGEWQEVAWSEAAAAVEELACGFLARGLAKGDRVAILGSTRLEWALVDLALASIGAVSVPVYVNSSARECLYVLEHAACAGIVVEDAEQLAKVDAAGLEHTLTFADLDGLRAEGRASPAGLPEVEPDDPYTFIYTSGTTGPPKACVIQHRHYYDLLASVERIEGLLVAEDVQLLFLPLAHNFGRLLHLAGPYFGLTIAFLPDPLRLAGALEEVRPTLIGAVPRVFEKLHSRITAALDDATGLRRRLVTGALAVGRRASLRRREGRRLSPPLAVANAAADRLVFSRVKERLGGRLRVAISGGAPLAPEIAEFFDAFGVLILEGYGLTESTSAVSVNRPARYRFGTVGPALPGNEFRIAGDGEVLVRGATIFAGYHRDDDATRTVLDEDGWLHTGDVGELDHDGYLRITDRKKDLIVTSGGKKIPPQNLENALKASKYVSQALVVGDRRPYVAALLTLEADEVARADGDPRELVQRAVDEVNRDLSRPEQIKRFTILPRDFSLEAGELTPTLKLRRRVCEDHFATEIEGLYR